MADKASPFTFQHIDGRKFLSLDGKEARDNLLKWSMKDRICAQAFTFDQPFQSYQKDDFVQSFMTDSNVTHHLKIISDSSNKMVQLGGLKAETVSADPVSCTVISMTFFDRLFDGTVARESGHIMKCFEEYVDDIIISDEVRKMVVCEDSDHYDLYSESNRQEFLFALFKHICLGGEVCQYEDDLKPYLDFTKALYKDLISVQKDSTGDLHPTSVVLKITAAIGDCMYYPSDRDHIQDFAYLIIDPLKRNCTVLCHKFGAGSME